MQFKYAFIYFNQRILELDFFSFEGVGESFFFLGKTDRQIMVIQTWRSGLFSKMKEVKLSLQEKLTVFVASGKI